MFAGGILAHPKGNDHVELEFYDAYDGMTQAFQHGGQEKILEETLAKISQHKSVVYLLFPFDFISQKEKIAKFTQVIFKCGGIAVKVETSGAAHDWDKWFELVKSENPFDQYRASVVLVGDENHYYSCGMHNFKLPDAQVSNQIDPVEAADLINRFNYWQIVENPYLESNHTFSLTAESPHFRLKLSADERYPADTLFHNSNGVWNLTTV